VLYIVLTDIKHLSADQLKKLNALGGGKGGDARVSYERQAGKELNLAVKDNCNANANENVYGFA